MRTPLYSGHFVGTQFNINYVLKHPRNEDIQDTFIGTQFNINMIKSTLKVPLKSIILFRTTQFVCIKAPLK